MALRIVPNVAPAALAATEGGKNAPNLLSSLGFPAELFEAQAAQLGTTDAPELQKAEQKSQRSAEKQEVDQLQNLPTNPQLLVEPPANFAQSTASTASNWMGSEAILHLAVREEKEASERETLLAQGQIPLVVDAPFVPTNAQTDVSTGSDSGAVQVSDVGASVNSGEANQQMGALSGADIVRERAASPTEASAESAQQFASKTDFLNQGVESVEVNAPLEAFATAREVSPTHDILEVSPENLNAMHGIDSEIAAPSDSPDTNWQAGQQVQSLPQQGAEGATERARVLDQPISQATQTTSSQSTISSQSSSNGLNVAQEEVVSPESRSELVRTEQKVQELRMPVAAEGVDNPFAKSQEIPILKSSGAVSVNIAEVEPKKDTSETGGVQDKMAVASRSETARPRVILFSAPAEIAVPEPLRPESKLQAPSERSTFNGMQSDSIFGAGLEGVSGGNQNALISTELAINDDLVGLKRTEVSLDISQGVSSSGNEGRRKMLDTMVGSMPGNMSLTSTIEMKGFSLEPPLKLVPHQVRLDAPEVSAKIVSLAKSGGGEVRIDVTPPDESTFKITLTVQEGQDVKLIVTGATDSTRTRLDQTADQLRQQFQQMGMNLSLDFGQSSFGNSQWRAPDQANSPEPAFKAPGVRAGDVTVQAAITDRPPKQTGVVHLYA